MKIEKGIRYPIRNGVVDKSKFEIRVTVNSKLRSKVIDRSLGIKEARRIKSEMFTEMNKSDYVEPTKISLTSLVNHYIKNEVSKDRPSTAERYTYDFRRFLKTPLANMRIDKIKPYHINKEMKQFEDEGLSGTYRKNIFAILSASMMWAERMSLIPHESPTRKIPTPKATPKEVKLWSQNEFNQFITEAKEITSSYKKLNQYHGYNYSYVIFFIFFFI